MLVEGCRGDVVPHDGSTIRLRPSPAWQEYHGGQRHAILSAPLRGIAKTLAGRRGARSGAITLAAPRPRRVGRSRNLQQSSGVLGEDPDTGVRGFCKCEGGRASVELRRLDDDVRAGIDFRATTGAVLPRGRRLGGVPEPADLEGVRMATSGTSANRATTCSASTSPRRCWTWPPRRGTAARTRSTPGAERLSFWRLDGASKVSADCDRDVAYSSVVTAMSIAAGSSGSGSAAPATLARGSLPTWTADLRRLRRRIEWMGGESPHRDTAGGSPGGRVPAAALPGATRRRWSR